jgi:hypothetical protein
VYSVGVKHKYVWGGGLISCLGRGWLVGLGLEFSAYTYKADALLFEEYFQSKEELFLDSCRFCLREVLDILCVCSMCLSAILNILKELEMWHSDRVFVSYARGPGFNPYHHKTKDKTTKRT